MTGAGSTWSNSSAVNIGNSGHRHAHDRGRRHRQPGLVVIATNAGAIGTLNIGAGVGNPAAAPGTLTAPSLAFGAGTGTLNFNHTSGTYVFAPAISGTGTVNVLAGTTTLTGANSYSGATNVNAGTLRAGALNTFSPNSAVTVASGGTLDLNGFDQTLAGLANAGLVNMGTGTAPGTVLTTTSYTGRGGTIAMNTFLGGDNSPSDRLVINGGTASGTSGLRITNTGGSGDLTLGNGIPVVVATNGGTTAPGAFGLSGPVVAGPYEYFLFRGGVTPGNENDWFLRNVAGPIAPEPPGPIPRRIRSRRVPSLRRPFLRHRCHRGCQAPVPIPFFRPEAVVYAGMPALARLIGKETLGTFHERQGDQSLLTKNGPLPIGWGRAFGERTEYRRGGALSPEFDGHLWGFQAGFDLAAVETWAGRDHFGAFVGHTEANGDVRGFSLGQRRAASGSVDLDATSLGLYWTHIGPSGWYLDSVLMHSWLDGSPHSNRGVGIDLDGSSTTASLEGGYPVLSRARPRARTAGADHLADRRFRPDPRPLFADRLRCRRRAHRPDRRPPAGHLRRRRDDPQALPEGQPVAQFRGHRPDVVRLRRAAGLLRRDLARGWRRHRRDGVAERQSLCHGRLHDQPQRAAR